MRAWLDRHGTAAVLPRREATPDGLAGCVRALLARPRADPVPPHGRAAAVAALQPFLTD
jgi:hypothetical protein